MIQNILFDLDGTLSESAVGIINSVLYALEKMEIDTSDIVPQSLLKFIGPPLKTSFQESYNFSQEEIAQAIVYYREYFNESGIYQNEIYPGVPEMLSTLQKSGKSLFVATSKPEFFAKQILENDKLSHFFAQIVGSPLEENSCTKSDIIKMVLDNNHLDPNTCIMVGDREHDIFGGHENHMKAVGVLYGYGSLDELNAVKADYIAKDTNELTQILLSL